MSDKMDKLSANINSLKRNNSEIEAMFTDFSTAMDAMVNICEEGVTIKPRAPKNGKLQGATVSK
jgi:hypothetical protein